MMSCYNNLLSRVFANGTGASLISNTAEGDANFSLYYKPKSLK